MVTVRRQGKAQRDKTNTRSKATDAPKSDTPEPPASTSTRDKKVDKSNGTLAESLVHVPQSIERESDNEAEQLRSGLEKKPPLESRSACSSSEKPTPPLASFAALNLLLKRLNASYSERNDLFLSSTGYPALFISALLAKKLPALAGRLAAYSSWISDYRTGWRVISTPATVQWAFELINATKSNPNKWLRASDYIQAVSGVAYQLLENLAFFASKNVINLSSDAQEVVWAISSMTWAVHVLLELLKAISRYLHGQPVDRLSLLTNLSWAPLTLHWSTRKGLFKPRVVGLLGSLATVPRLLATLNK